MLRKGVALSPESWDERDQHKTHAAKKSAIMDGQREWESSKFRLVWNQLLMPVNDEAHLNEGYSYNQSSFRGWFVERVNGDDFGVNFINKTRNMFCIRQLKHRTFEANEQVVTWYVCKLNLSSHRSDLLLQVLVSEADYFPLQSRCQ